MTHEHDKRLLAAAVNRDMVDVETCLWRGADVEARDAHGRTALYHAVRLGDMNLARLLRQHDARMDVVDEKDGWPMLMWPVSVGNHEMVDFLLRCGVSPALPNSKGETALHLAALRRDVRMASMLVLWGKKDIIDVPDVRGQTPRQIWPQLDDVHEMRRNREDTANLSYVNAQLFKAVTAKEHEKVRGLLNPGYLARMFWGAADVNVASCADGRTVLMEAILNNDEKMVDILLIAGADVNRRDNLGRTVVHMAACRSSHRNMILAVKHAPHLLEEEHLFRKTPLWLAAHNRNAMAVEVLLAAGADPDRVDGEFGIRPSREWPEVAVIAGKLKKQTGLSVPKLENLPVR